MRFLCLHGMGTNSDIFRSQLGSLVSDLEDQGHEFVFLDGEVECQTSDDVRACYPGPYLCYYPCPTYELVRDAHEIVHEFIEENGPFEGVIAFSQGAALASSLMLEYSKTSPYQDLFEVAIFAGASLPFDLDHRDGEKTLLAVVSNPGQAEHECYSYNELTAGYPVAPWEVGGGKLLGRYHPALNAKVRIVQPTVHIIGAKDEYAGQAQVLTRMCTGNKTVVGHTSGHCIPRDSQFQRLALDAVQKMISRFQMRC